ncbi:hypothetical protein SCP_0109220 [Sparassis crispa]|uniref:Uncharacterized protein n=1 Tax=Sparassis crispa TaxID=139825 RepID=A0A401G788_9APHY|nr:hypothetical protein SCP_0109220 [Sparassis crispa]GBE78040.1 hypothetical protein SCP_0109220 [Sparassis crispa]
MVVDTVELEMLEHGTFTESDMFLDAPFFGEGIHDPAVLTAYVDHYSRLNAATAAASQPLTSYTAHSSPRFQPDTSSENSFLQAINEMMVNLGSDEGADVDKEGLPPLLGPIPPSADDEEAAKDVGILDDNDEDNTDEFVHGAGNPISAPEGWEDVSRRPADDHWDALISSQNWEEVDPFEPHFEIHNISTADLLVLLLVAPGTALPFMTLKTANQILGLDLETILSIEGSEDLLNEWRKVARKDRVYQDIFDGAIAKTLRGPDGKPFFANEGVQHVKGPDNELRIGLSWAIDWFSYRRSLISPSHSSCPTSFSISNLPPEYRYRTSNLMLTSILPGPKEQTGDQVQRFIRPIVSDLLRLWKDGIVVKTPSSPEGRRVHVALLAVVCDKPAAHKIGGFGSHSHTYPCTQDWITKQDIGTPKAFEKNAFEPRTDKKQRELGERYRNLKTEKARTDFVRAHATRYTELSRLPYFDLVRQIVIDPMHNLFLGLTKSHFYHIWVQKDILRENHELRILHEMLQDFSLPNWTGRLPTDIGMPAGGSLTADQWKLLVITQAPIIIPQLWRNCLPKNPQAFLQDRVAQIAAEEKKQAEDRKKAAEEHTRKKAEKDAAKAAGKTKKPRSPQTANITERTALNALPAMGAADEVVPPLSSGPNSTSTSKIKTCQLHPDDPANFLKLSETLCRLTADILIEEDLPIVDHLLREYSTELIRLYGKSSVKTNNHYSIHTTDCVRSFGPLRDFWSFLYERLNKVLKSYNSNNHGDGELETTFFGEFHRTAASARVVNFMAHDASGGPHIQRLGHMMLKATHDGRGTVAGLAAWAKEADQDSSEGACEPIWDQFTHLNVQLWHLEEYLPVNEAVPVIIELPQIKGHLARMTVTVGSADVKLWATVPLDNSSRDKRTALIS